MMSRRRCHSAVAARTSLSGASKATEAASIAMPTWQTTFEMPTRPTSAMRSAGPPTQPMRQPVQQPDIDRIRHHHLVARLDGGEQHIEDPREAPSADQAAAPPVIVDAAHPGDMSRGSAAQTILPEKRQVAVGGIVVDGVPR